eukprot:CAMPEP_0117690102 /NCGR_PEP_ID=MMETSP0804-20121206/24925_1 /TAXON_ID=1074897 /ORGANISM="Tetraselmis astigmatica, Strain CCMP880" /LENGTH=45 /DNA_ID= /DNA_START= /DNA_END= /DNA_ORIENTATION=
MRVCHLKNLECSITSETEIRGACPCVREWQERQGGCDAAETERQA